MLEDIKGQKKAKAILQNLILRNRFPHSLLFYGPSGCGKFLTAKSIVKYFNCQAQDPEMKGKDNCSNCHRIDEEIFPDLFVVRKEKKEIKIEQIRDMIRQINLKPFESQYKFFIIDGADAMNLSSENSFLKTLEEPLPNNFIILIAHNLNSLLDTIISRCMKIQFNNLKVDTIADLLNEKEKIDKKKSKQIAFLSNGSLEKAYELLEENNVEKIFEKFEFFLSSVGPSRLDIPAFEKELTEVSKWAVTMIENILELFLLYFIDWIYDQKYAISKSEIFKNYLNINLEYIKFKSYNLLISKIIEARFQVISTNVNIKLLLESLLLTIRDILNESR
ncbi:MAG: DNA polymerase III subunit delta' [Spirochaetes bacterium]|nr:DNA polymerase III subunit delta' [Spirochaetota bacterium]